MTVKPTLCKIIALGLGAMAPGCASDDPIVSKAGGQVVVTTCANSQSAIQQVVFHDARGAFLDALPVGEDGTVSFALERPGIVSMVVGDHLQETYSMETIFDVRPGERIALCAGDDGDVESTQTVGELKVQTAPVPAGAGYVDIDSRCLFGAWHTAQQETAIDSAIDIDGDCVDQDDTIDVLALARSESALVAFASAQDVPVSLVKSDTPLVLGAWRTDWARTLVQLDNVPADVFGGKVDIMLEGQLGEGRYAPWLHNGGLFSEDESAEVLIPKDFGSRWDYVIDLFYRSDDEHWQRTEYRRPYDSVPETIDLDASTSMLPRIEALETNAANPSRIEVSWSSGADVASHADVVEVALHWAVQRKPGDPVSLREGTWRAYAPADASLPLIMPELPEDLAPWRPQSADEITATQVTVSAFDWIEDFHAAIDQSKRSYYDQRAPIGSNTQTTSAFQGTLDP